MKLDELINNLTELRNLIGGSVDVIADSDNYVVSCHKIESIKDEYNDRNAVVINLTK